MQKKKAFRKYTVPTKNSKYIDFETNGKLFPSWILRNFKHYQLPKIILAAGIDPCKKDNEKQQNQKSELRKYQTFISEYLTAESPYRGILIYHGLGSGKTASSINLYNILYNHDSNWNMFVLLKSSLKESWVTEIEKFIENTSMKESIHFITYDSATAMKQLEEKKKFSDATKKSLFVIEEAHNFINSVYGSVKKGMLKNSIKIYEEILQEQKEKPETKVVLLSGTPMINKPFELALLFNLIRPGAFPTSEDEFNHIYVTNSEYPSLNKHTKNRFQRRILGLVSYYYGSTPDYYASIKHFSVNSEMSSYQYSKYFESQLLEDKISLNMIKKGRKSTLFKTYTRQTSNFVFPNIYGDEQRPKSIDFKLTEREISEIENKSNSKITAKNSINYAEYHDKLKYFIEKFVSYLNTLEKEDESNGHTINDDITEFANSNITFAEFNKLQKKSKIYQAMYESSAKYTNAIFNVMRCNGAGLVYANYVKVEGLEMFKIYLSYCGFGVSRKYNFIEFHSEIDIKDRYEGMKRINAKDNITGSKVKLILISSAGVEGLNLNNIRHVHILDPYWNETRIKQVIGRAIRACSHVDLPIDERIVNVYRYHSVSKKSKIPLVDTFIESLAKRKNEMENTFLDAMKEAAVDCVLYKNHNMINTKYKCFQFSENSLFDKYIGPAYRKNITQDAEFDNGSNSSKFQTLTIKTRKIRAVKIISNDPIRYSLPDNYLLYKKTSVVYDFDMHYPIGSIMLKPDGLPEIYKENIYIINKVIPIPIIDFAKK